MWLLPHRRRPAHARPAAPKLLRAPLRVPQPLRWPHRAPCSEPTKPQRRARSCCSRRPVWVCWTPMHRRAAPRRTAVAALARRPCFPKATRMNRFFIRRSRTTDIANRQCPSLQGIFHLWAGAMALAVPWRLVDGRRRLSSCPDIACGRPLHVIAAAQTERSSTVASPTRRAPRCRRERRRQDRAARTCRP
jgi:hypothetical protein